MELFLSLLFKKKNLFFFETFFIFSSNMYSIIHSFTRILLHHCFDSSKSTKSIKDINIRISKKYQVSNIKYSNIKNIDQISK